MGSYVGNDMYHKYEEDIKLLKSLNFKSFRTSMQWTRLLDQDGKFNFSIIKDFDTIITESSIDQKEINQIKKYKVNVL